MKTGKLVLLLFILLSGLISFSARSDQSVEEVSVGTSKKISTSGFLSSYYRNRQTSDEADQDIYQYLDLKSEDNQKGRYSFYLFGRGAYDLDGETDDDRTYVFDSIEDSYHANPNGNLYYAYLDLHKIKNIDTIRIGRQSIYETPITVYFDGVRIDSREYADLGRLKAGFYAGVPVHLYEDNPGLDDVVGLYVQSRPWRGGRIKLDYIHIDDDNLYGVQSDDLVALRYWHALSRHLSTHFMFSHVGSVSRDLLLKTTYFNENQNFILEGSYYELLEEQRFFAIHFDPFFTITEKYYPYRQGSLMVYKGVGDNLGVSAGLDGRWLVDDNNESIFNHQFVRYYAGLSLYDLPTAGFEADIFAEVWNSEDNDSEVNTYSGEIRYSHNEIFNLALGADYALYKYDFYLADELENVWTYFFRTKINISKRFEAEFKYSYEDEEFEEYQRAQLGLIYYFGEIDAKSR
jgi:hypothetical protein